MFAEQRVATVFLLDEIEMSCIAMSSIFELDEEVGELYEWSGDENGAREINSLFSGDGKVFLNLDDPDIVQI